MQEILLELKHKNELLNNLEILVGNPCLSSFPSHLEIEFTNACNLRCYMCYQSNHKVKYSQISNNSLTHVTRVLPYVKTILIAGLGEPLLYQRLDKFLKTAKKSLCEISMFTNGILADKHLDIFKYLSLLTVSFDGATPEVFETQRHGANFGRVLHNIQLLRKTYPEMQIRLSCVVSKLNSYQIEHIAQIGSDIGVNIVSFSHVQHAPTIELTKSDYPIIKKQLNNAIQFAEDNHIVIQHNDIEYLKKKPDNTEIDNLLTFVKKESKDRELKIPKDFMGLRRIISSRYTSYNIKFFTVEDLKRANSLLDSEINRILKTIKGKHIKQIIRPYCLSAWNYAFVKMNGNFRLCPYFDLEAGSINNKNFSKGINNSLLIEIRTSLFKRKNMLAACKSCPDRFHREFKNEIFEQVCEKFGIIITEN